VKGVKFDGIDIFHAAPHTNIDFTDDEVKRLAEKVQCVGWRSAPLLPRSGRRWAAALPWALFPIERSLWRMCGNHATSGRSCVTSV
jgi:hypothetical protein